MKTQRIIIYSSLLILILFGTLGFLFLKSSHDQEQDKANHLPTVFMGLIIDQNDASIPYFLKSIEKLDYDKSKIKIEIHLLNDRKVVDQTVQRWADKQRSAYEAIQVYNDYRFLPKNHTSSESEQLRALIKDSVLREAREQKCRYCLITTSGTFLEPKSLAFLINKRKPVIAPMLRPIPQANDVYRNFFCDVNEGGYYKDHPDYIPISRFEKRGTFRIPCVHAIYLIDTDFADRLSFTKDPEAWEFITFSKNARNNDIQQYISNEIEMGFMFHFADGTTKEDERSYVPINPDAEITKPLLEKLVSPYYKQNPYLKQTVQNFPLENYTLFRLQNRDLYIIDDIHDSIKRYILKLGMDWETNIHDQFKKYTKPGTVAVDIGGHIGTHTLNLSRLIGDKGTVHVFEPQTKLFCELKANMHLNGCQNVVYHPLALGTERKEIEIHFPEEAWMAAFPKGMINEGHGTVRDASDSPEGNRTVMIRLDDLNIDNISIMKIDVEGFEMDVIHGGVETIKRSKPTMLVEIFNNETKNDKIKEIEALGYVHSHLGFDDYLFVPKTE